LYRSCIYRIAFRGVTSAGIVGIIKIVEKARNVLARCHEIYEITEIFITGFSDIRFVSNFRSGNENLLFTINGRRK